MPGMKHAFALVALAAAWLPSAASAQAPAAGRLLVATPALDDPNFTESVLLLIEHSEEGSLAIFINRPTWIDAFETFPELPPLANYAGTLFLGGPLAPTQLVVLLRSAPGPEIESLSVFGDVHLTADLAVLDEAPFAGAGDETVRVFAGHAAWAPGQLEEEIDDGAWRVVQAGAELVFDSDPLGLWQAVLEIDAADFVTAARSPGRHLDGVREPRRNPAEPRAEAPAPAAPTAFATAGN